MDEDDYDLIRENANKKKLKKVIDTEENDMVIELTQNKSNMKKKAKA